MPTPITGLDHVSVITHDLDRAVRDFEALSGWQAAWRGSGSGVETAVFALANVSLALIAVKGSGAAGERVRAQLDGAGEGLAGICFRIDDADRMSRRLERLRLEPKPTPEAERISLSENDPAGARIVSASTSATWSIPISFLERKHERTLSLSSPASPVTGLDHVVISTPDSDRAAALYGARLGLDMALDLMRPDWGVRLMFFRCGDLIIETAQRLQGPAGGEADRFAGLSWRVPDAVAAQARLAAAGFDVSDVRTGRKPGTKVFSVRNRTAGVPTVFVQPSGDARGNAGK